MARRRPGRLGILRFKAKRLLTDNELEFLARLEAAVPELRFHAQVSMGALLMPAIPREVDARAFFQARGKFSQKIVDFVAQRRSDGEVVAVIELDDRTHNPAKDAARDDMMTEAGYRTVRWQSRNRPSAAEIRAALLEQGDEKPTAQALQGMAADPAQGPRAR